ncbi:hybrid sensor histidine kinase/response regulator [Caballeronia zhejiangensis]|uniref:hybrid sensor histidine kinase/response regulator n=1 Tax=Caballeronia zhejiangensis TaxID=871203 RepID=UPI001FD2B4F7|nr:ATP-binding protein [Caballeronia zhejiangensis]
MIVALHNMIARQIAHVKSLIDDLLEVSRVTQGRVSLEERTVDMKQVVHDSCEQVRPVLESHRHRLNLHLPAEAICVRGDHNRLVQVMSNLLNNAAKYTPGRGVITLSAERGANEVIVRLKDNGIGMEPELLKRAFDLFQQGERDISRNEGGLGLGLALVKSLVEQQRGTVTAVSEGAGKGSELVVRLPLVGETATKRQTEERVLTTRGSSPRRRVLLVDDNVEVAESVGMVLEILGHEVAIEHEAQGALERAKHERFDRCILDIGLPGMNGYELARELRQISGTREAVFVAHTGYGQSEDRRLSSEAGFTHHLVKPAAILELERVLADGH